jgi:hypothetical protein
MHDVAFGPSWLAYRPGKREVPPDFRLELRE